MKRSWTAQGAVAQRAVLTDVGVLKDPYARRMLTPAMARIAWIWSHVPKRAFARSVTLAGFSGADLWFDEALRSALDDGVRQVAVIGAGYDSRSWRFARDGVTFFELDHDASQQAKKQAAPEPGPRYVTADLRRDSAVEALFAGGIRPEEPVVVLAQSVVMYLTEPVVRQQFSDLAGALASRSRLLVNFQSASPPSTVRTKRQLRLQRLARVGSGEGFRFGIDPDGAANLVTDTGWTVDESTSVRSAARALVPAAMALPVNAIDERKTLISAHLTR